MGVLSLTPLYLVYSKKYKGKKFKYASTYYLTHQNIYSISRISRNSAKQYIVHYAKNNDSKQFKFPLRQFLKDIDFGWIIWQN